MPLGKLLIAWRASLRRLSRNPRNSLLSVVSIALGVSVFLAITIANRAAVESFHHAFEQITGKADLEIRGDLPETALPLVQACKGITAVTPLIEGMVTLPDYPGETLHLVGIDPLTAAGVLTIEPTMDAPGEKSGGLEEWLGNETVIAVSAEFLARHHLHRGDSIRMLGPGAPRRVRIATTMKSDTATMATDGRVAAMDIAAAQEWIGTRGKLTALLLRLEDRSREKDVIAALSKVLPTMATIAPPARRTQQVDLMLASFRMNLTALSLVSLMVGMFFVGNASAASVIRHRVSLGILRAVGVSKRMILGMVLGEASVCGAVGGGLGILVAPWIAGLLAAPVAQTVTALYLPVESHPGWPTPWEALAGLIAGIGAALVAAWIPAMQAARVDPTQVLHPGAATEIFPMPIGQMAILGGAALGAALTFSLGALHGGPALLGFGAAFFVLCGFSLFVPAVTTCMSRGLGWMMRRVPSSAIFRLALDLSMRSLYRTVPTIAALAAAVAMLIGISVMIYSFRGSVMAWTDRTLTADLFIAPAANELLGLVQTLPSGAAAWWTKQEQVHEVGTFREEETRTQKGEAVTLGVIAGPARGTIDFLHGDGSRKTQALFRGEGVAISESLAQRLHLASGDILMLATPRGVLQIQVLDLYRDYTRDRGMAMMGADLYRRLWGEQGIHSLAIVFRPETTQAEIDREVQQFKNDFGGAEAFICYSNRSLKARVIEIFNQTFAVTSVLKSISIAMAVGGVMLTLGMLVLERARDIGVLRSMGASAVQIVQMIMAEAALIGAIASLVGLFSGAALSLVLTWVINKAFFGWSIDLSYPWLEMTALPFWMIGVSLLAGIGPAMRAASIPPATAIRSE